MRCLQATGLQFFTNGIPRCQPPWLVGPRIPWVNRWWTTLRRRQFWLTIHTYSLLGLSCPASKNTTQLCDKNKQLNCVSTEKLETIFPGLGSEGAYTTGSRCKIHRFLRRCHEVECWSVKYLVVSLTFVFLKKIFGGRTWIQKYITPILTLLKSSIFK